MKDRRHSERLNILKAVIVFVDGCEDEIDGMITDFSEENIGLKLTLSDEQLELLKKNMRISVQFVDKYQYGSQDRTQVVMAEVLVKRLEQADGECSVGGIVRNEDFKIYAINRKLADYYKN